METVPDFATAVQSIMSTTFVAPQYFIMAGSGPNEGVVITADRALPAQAASPKPYLSMNALAPQVGSWFIVQTNDRSWEPPEDSRRSTIPARSSRVCMSLPLDGPALSAP